MKQTLIIRDESIRGNAIEAINLIPFSPLHEIVIRPYHQDRTTAQNSLMWKWLTDIGNSLGETKDAVHIRYKGKFLVPIYIRDDPDYAATIESVRKVHRMGGKVEAIALYDAIVKLTSTTTATTAQFTEYLEDIEHDAAGIGIILPRPEDRYYLAMGIKR